MEINDKLLKKLFDLSALYLDDKEKTEIQNYLRETLSHFEKIKEIDTKNIKPLVSPLRLPLRLREDEVQDFLNKESLLDQAPKRQGNLIKTPSTV